MLIKQISSLAAVILFAVSPLIYAADMTPTDKETFHSTCVNAWLGRFKDVKDKTDYQNFGDKYCECAGTQPLEGSDAIDKAAKICMTRTLLSNAMDKLEEDGDLEEATESSIDEYCMGRWQLVYPQMNDRLKQVATTYCGCAKSKLLSLIKDSNDMTDKQYYDHIDTIASTCSANL